MTPVVIPERKRFSRVLVVEDDAAQRHILADLLQDDGFDVVTCETAEQALRQMSGQSFGVAILDLRLPDLPGTALLERIRALDGRVRVIIHTGYGSFHTAKDAVNHGAFAYVEKLGDPRELLQHVHRAVTAQVAGYAAELEEAVARRTAALQESESRLRAVIEGTPDALLVTDPDGHIETFNPTAARLFGYRPEEVVGRRVDALVAVRPAVDPAEFLDRYWKPGPADPARPGELVGRRKDGGTFPVDAALGEVRLHGRRLVAAFLRDVTERHRLEDQLRQAQKMEAIGRLAGGIAHDFNNLLTVIGGYTELLLCAPGESAESRGMVQQIHQAVDRAASLTRQLLSFSRQQPLNPKVLDLNAAVTGATQLLQRLIGEDVELRAELAPDLAPVRADLGQIEQVLMNLAANARDAMPAGGRLVLRTRNDGDAGDGAGVLLEVADTGVGMDEATQARIFEPFFTTKPVGKGTGLGLATVYGIVRQSRGTIAVDSAPDRGSTFRLRFPACPRPVAAAPAPAPAAPPARGRETILLVEDEAGVRQLTLVTLQSHGYQVLTAANGAEALDLLGQHADPLHLLVTDLVMPRMGGRELAEHVRTLRPDLKILFISGYSAEFPTIQETTGKDRAFLQKPFTLSALTRTIRELLDRN